MRLFAILGLLFAVAPFAWAGSNCSVQNNILSCGPGKLTNLPSGEYSYASLDEVRVLNAAVANAEQINVKRSSLNDVNFSAGNAAFQKTLLKGDVDIVAEKIDLTDSVIRQDASLSATYVNIEHSITDGLNINAQSAQPLCVSVTNGSAINGDITFNQNNGEVYFDKKSQFRGKINGGQLINQPCNEVL